MDKFAFSTRNLQSAELFAKKIADAGWECPGIGTHPGHFADMPLASKCPGVPRRKVLYGLFTSQAENDRRSQTGKGAMAEHGASLLVVEDDEILANELALILVEHGYRVLGPATNVSDALRILAETKPDAAVLDFRLSENSISEPVLAVLEKWNVPICVMSGSLREELLPEFAKYPVLHKPFSARELLEAVGRLV